MKFLKIFCAGLLAVSGLFAQEAVAQSSSKGWKEAKNVESNFKAVSSHPDVEVFSAPNIVMLKINKPTEVRIFTILGKLLSAQKLEQGIFEYELDAHGVYIIQTEENSFKVAI